MLLNPLGGAFGRGRVTHVGRQDQHDLVVGDELLTAVAKHQLARPDDEVDQQRDQFLTAFVSRNAAPTRKRLKDLAIGSFAWFLAEPSHELAWYELAARPGL